MTTTVIVADEATARVFSSVSFRANLNEIRSFTNKQGRELERETSTELPRRTLTLKHRAPTHETKESQSHHHHSKHIFAKEVTSYIEDLYQKNSLGHLVIVAAAEFLGELRRTMPAEIEKSVILEMPKDLTKLDIEQIYQHLQVYYGR
jgi:protein required for attachment to host cells